MPEILHTEVTGRGGAARAAARLWAANRHVFGDLAGRLAGRFDRRFADRLRDDYAAAQ